MKILNDIGCNLNWREVNFLNSIQFNSTIELKFYSVKIKLKRNEMQIDEERIENLLMNIVLKQKKNLRYKFEKTPFHASLLGNGLSRF